MTDRFSVGQMVFADLQDRWALVEVMEVNGARLLVREPEQSPFWVLSDTCSAVA